MAMLNELRPESYEKRDRSLKGRLKELLPWKGDDTKEIIRKLIYLTAVAVLIYSFYGVWEYRFGTSDLHESKDDLSNLYHSTTDSPEDLSQPSVTQPEAENPVQENPGGSSGDNSPQTPAEIGRASCRERV